MNAERTEKPKLQTQVPWYFTAAQSEHPKEEKIS